MGAVGSCSLLCASVGCDVVIQNAILAAWDSVTRRNFVQSCHENVPRLVRDYEYSFVFRPHAQGSRYLLISTVSTMFAKSVIRSSRILVLTATWVVIDLSESHSGTSAFEWFLIHCFFFLSNVSSCYLILVKSTFNGSHWGFLTWVKTSSIFGISHFDIGRYNFQIEVTSPH